MQSPRRSPRISAEGLKTQKATLNGRARASTGALKADKENDPTISPTARKGKAVRRAHSMGGELLRKSVFEKDNTLSGVPSRRNVPGPRKSAIRALPPQVFASPTSAGPPSHRVRSTLASVSSDSISAFGGSELMDLMNSVEPARNTRRTSELPTKQKPRSSMSSANQNKAPAVIVSEATAEDDDNTIARKKRRVTFNPYQERTDFYLEEPTMRIRPSAETELVTTGNSSGSHDSSDMSLDSDDSGLQSVDESSMMEMTAPYSESNSLLDASISDDSAMEMTVAYGGVLDRTAHLPSGQEDVDDDSESEQDSSDDGQESTQSDKDVTVTMQFTSVYGADDANDSEIEEIQGIEEEGEDDEVDIQLTEVDEDSFREEQDDTVDLGEEDNSAMEMTEIYEQPTENATPRKNRDSTTHSHQHSIHLSSPDGATASPRIGHEYCKIPAADSPKHNLSRASLKAQARRQSMSQSPVKPTTPSSKSMLGTSTTSPFKASLRTSVSDKEKTQNRQSIPRKRSASPDPPSPSPPRQSSPAKSPTTPSRVWKSFRRSQGNAETTPAKRVSVDAQSPSKGGFGSPQRIVVQSKTKQPPPSSVKKEEQMIPEEERWTMKQFFDSLDLGFLELNMPSKRKVDADVKGDVLQLDTAELIKAACAHLPFLESLVGACEELESTVIEGRSMALEHDSAFYSEPPLYVAEVVSMKSAEKRQQAISAFRIQKSAARANALQAYYAWRTDRQFSDDSLLNWEKIRGKLEDDVQFVLETSKMVKDEILPGLRSRHHHLLEQVESERKRQTAIGGCDDEEMNELHRAMEEQGSVLSEQQASHREARDELERVQLQVKQIAARQRDAQEATDTARMSHESIAICTKEEAIRLARQTKHLETLHLWTLRRADLGEIALELEECLLLTLYIKKAAVSRAMIKMSRGGNLWQDTLQQAVDDRLSSAQQDVQPADIIRFVTTAWTRMRHFTNVFEVLLARFPTEMETYTHDKGSGLVVRASVLLPRRKSKVLVEARCGMNRLLHCKTPLFDSDDISARCIYGSVDAPAIAAQIADCITMGSSAGNLTKAILKAIETFD